MSRESTITERETRANAWLSLGANVGDPAATIGQALGKIGRLPDTRIVDISPIYRTAPVGYTDQPPFLNLAISVRTELAPEEIVSACRTIERDLGRQDRPRWHEREIDIDLLIYDQVLISRPGLTVPHPRMNGRAFVMIPLGDIAPDLIHPVTGESIAAIRDQLPQDPLEWIEQFAG
jgi:2-amino-4-hydroxy-6-hydroxymethyldihydropteridine diphosphokinase